MREYNNSDELYHWGIKGMKWGVRRYRNEDGTLTEAGKKRYSDDEPEQIGYKSTGLKARRARKANEKVDEGFKRWEESDKHRDNAISLGKKATAAKLAYESDKSNKDAKSAYKQADKEYKKALNENTTYQKGVVRSRRFGQEGQEPSWVPLLKGNNHVGIQL